MNSADILTKVDSLLKDNKHQDVLQLMKEYKHDNLYTLFNMILNITDDDKKEEKTHHDNKEIKVAMVCNWLTSEELVSLWSKFSQDSKGKWNNIQIVPFTDEKDVDYTVVINSYNKIPLNKNKVIVFQMEPNMSSNRWGYWADPSALAVISPPKRRNNCEWHLSKTYSELLTFSPVKRDDNTLSAVLSGKRYDDFQRKRLDFIYSLIALNQVKIDLYGTADKAIKSLPLYQKDEGLFPYKYHFACENHRIDNYVTEKLYDAILSECLCFYCGAPNVSSIIDPRAYITIDLNNFEQSINTVINAIANNEWEERISYIKESKKRILNELQFFPYLEKIIKEERNC